MMPALRDELDSVRSTALSVGARLVDPVVSASVVAGWSLFWSKVVRLHYSQGDLDAAVIMTALLVVSAIGILVRYVGRSTGVDAITPADANGISN